MALLSIQNLVLNFGNFPVLDGINIQIHEGEKICLLGRNGTGKSSLMRIINGDMDPDSGDVIRARGMSTSLLRQELPEGISGSIQAVLRDSPSGGGRLRPPENNDEPSHKIDRISSIFRFDRESLFENLSAGMKRKVLLAGALVKDPDILLLDEPTNHLDIDSILWLEDFLAKYRKTVFFVTHDRSFLRKIADRIIELDRGKLYDWKCGYDVFLERKDAYLEAEQSRNALFDRKLAAEELWIRRGIKARRTRNEGRVRALRKMRKERSQRRELPGTVSMQLQKMDISGKMVIEAENVSFGYGPENLINNFSARIIRGAKIGIVGPNGCGKSTLVKLLLKELEPLSGSVRTGSGINAVYSDQLRESLDTSITVKENIMDGSEIIDFNGRKKHVTGYLQDFLFSPSMADMKAGVLSGGEKNRLMLAKLFTRPFNFLIMDEPTNDLDIETIELLEELLLDYEGTLLLVSHDRSFINNIVNSVFAFDGGGNVNEYAGGYDEWLAGRSVEGKSAGISAPKVKRPSERVKTKLSVKEKKELVEIPLIIESRESRKKEIFLKLSDPSVYRGNGAEIVSLKDELARIDSELAVLFARWEELESFENAV